MHAGNRHQRQALAVLEAFPQDVILKQQFVTSVNEAVATLFRARQAKEDSLRRDLSNGSMHSKQRWTKLKYASGMGRHTDILLIADADGHEYATSAEKSEAFGRFFAKKCSIRGGDISAADLPPHDLPTSQPFSTIHFRPEAVRRVLARLDTSKASGPDEISAPGAQGVCQRPSFTNVSAVFPLIPARHSTQDVENGKRGSYPQKGFAFCAPELPACFVAKHHLEGDGDYCKQPGYKPSGTPSAPHLPPVWFQEKFGCI